MVGMFAERDILMHEHEESDSLATSLSGEE